MAGVVTAAAVTPHPAAVPDGLHPAAAAVHH